MADLTVIRHSVSHVMAAAVRNLWPDAKIGIGPAIEDGFYYDFELNHKIEPSDFKIIEKEMRKIIEKDLKFVKKEVSKSEARKLFKGERYKLELIDELKDGEITVYTIGNFTDLCKGPHVKSTKEIKAFKMMKTAGAYWRGDSSNKMLTRIYGTAFSSEKELKDYLNMMEEAKKRDHRVLGKEMDLFSFHEEGPGFVFWHSNGMVLRNEVINYWREVHKRNGYCEISTPTILSKELWLRSGHWENYKENMYFTAIEGKEFAIKPMNCPGGLLVYKTRLHSYKEFPLKIAELGLVHRHELSGVVHGLLRVRNFTQDDAHIFCTEEQVKDEVKKVIELVFEVYKAFGFDNFEIELGTRPEKAIGTKEMWGRAEKLLADAVKDKKLSYKLNEGEGAFYGPKIDFHIKDCIGRKWQCGTIQADFSMPERFELSYDGDDNKKHRPVMIHRTVLGSLERFIGILIEHYAGRLPVWLSPVQVAVITVADRHIEGASNLVEMMKSKGIRAELDSSQESISKKVRNNQQMKIPYIVTFGDKEAEGDKIAVRDRDGKVKNHKINEFISDVVKEVEKRE